MTDDRSSGELLQQLADTLNKLYDLGVRPTPRYGAVMTDVGYVLPGLGGGDFVVRMKINEPGLVPAGSDPDDD